MSCEENPPVVEGERPIIDTFYHKTVERGLTRSSVKLIWKTRNAKKVTIIHYGDSDYLLPLDGDTTVIINNGLHIFTLIAQNEFFSTRDSIEFFVEQK